MLRHIIKSLLGIWCLILGLTCCALAEPPQVKVVDGDGTLSQTQAPAASTTDFTVSGHIVGETSRADILPDETWNVRFSNPNDSFLLRVLDPSGTRILGNLNIYYGSFVLLNTHGIDIGALARVNVNHAVFVASTIDIQNRDFIAGKYAFDAAHGAANRTVVNHGLIRTMGSSSVVLLGQAVENAGVIEAPLSKVALAAGDAVTLSLDANGLIGVEVADPVKSKVLDGDGREVAAQVANTGTITADGGTVLISARSLNDVFNRSVNLEGRIQANQALQGADGTIRIVASDKIVNTGVLATRNGKLYLTSDGAIETSGHLAAGTLVEQGASWRMGGEVQVGTASMDNADGAAVLSTGSYTGTFEDSGDIIVDNDARITLTGATVFGADTDPGTQAHDGNGIFTMNTGSSIIGGGHALTLYSADRDSAGGAASSVLRDISGVNGLNLYRSSAATASPAYTLRGTLDAGAYNLDIDGDIVLDPGGALTNAADIFITGNWTNNGGTFTPGASRVNFISTIADQLINGTAVAQVFYDIRVAKGSKTLSVGGSTTALSLHDLALDSGIFATGTATTVNVAGNVVFNSLAVTGFNGLTLDADTFTANDVVNMIGNTARTYYPVTDAVLDAMIAGSQVKTLIIGVPYDQDAYGWLANYWGGSVPVGTNRVNMVDRNYVAYIAHVKDRIASAGSSLKLIVEFGNEYNLHPEWFGGDSRNWFSALTAAVSAVHAAFGNSVRVSTATGDIPADFVTTIRTGVDLVGVNTYRGLGNTSSLVADWNTACSLTGMATPLYVSESGFPSWVWDGGEAQQDINVLSLRDEFLKNNLGITFMSFEDNMRKGGSLFTQDSREDYWGWLRANGTHKAVYDTMSAAWALPEFQAGAAHINVAGDWVNNGGTFTAGTSTVTFDASNAGHIVKSGTSAFADVVFDDGGKGGAWTVATDPMQVNGNLSLTSGHVTLGMKLMVGGNLDIVNATLDAVGKTIELAGDWRNAGLFIHGNNTVTLTGDDQTVAGDNTFYNLTKTSAKGSALTFEAGSVQAIAGALTLTGCSDVYMRLRSDVPGKQWKMRAASVDMQWLDLKDSWNTGDDITPLNFLDSGNNTGYAFDPDYPALSTGIFRLDVLDIHGLTFNLAVAHEARLAAQFLGSSLIEMDVPFPGTPPVMFGLSHKFMVE